MKGDKLASAADSAGAAVAAPAARRSAPLAYIAIVVVAACLALAAFLRTQGAFACPGPQSAGNEYLAYCQADKFGDYDHGAVFFGLEPRVRAGAARADVLFLGSSRMQFAFSSRATSDWFKQAGGSHYLLGFSHTENMQFTGPLLADLKPKARAYVINVDRFFDDKETAPARQILHEPDARARYGEKRFWMRVQGWLCGAVPALCASQVTFVRFYETGAWTLRGAFPYQGTGVADDAGTDRARWNRYTELARDFVGRLPVDRACVFLTLVPSESTKTAEARFIAEALGRPLYAPRPEGLRTFDTSHLDRPSADAFSAAFFAAAGPELARCLGASPRP